MRKITVASNSMEPITFESNSTTLAELKNDLRSRNINFSDMSFKEGVTRTTLTDDSSVLPTTKADGSVIDELFIMMSGATKKIRSGSVRTDLYAIIKEILKKNPSLKSELGNYTCKSNDEIKKFVDKYHNTKPTKAKANKSENTSKIVEAPTTQGINKQDVITAAKLVLSYLENTDNMVVSTISVKKTEEPVEIKPVKEIKSSFSPSEMRDMMNR